MLKSWISPVATLILMPLRICNFLHARYIEEVHLKITPQASSYEGRDLNGRIYIKSNRDRYDQNLMNSQTNTSLSMEIINLSKFPVILKEVGFSLRRDRGRLALITPIIPDGKSLPYKLESREPITIYFDNEKLLNNRDIARIHKAYAKTACGKTCFGSSGALRDFGRYVKQL